MMTSGTCRVAMLSVLASALLASCGGGGGDNESVAPAPPPAGPSDADRIAAATATANTNAKCSDAVLGPYYWEIGDASGRKASGSRGAGAPTATTALWVFSSSKWLYAASVVQKRGVQASDVPYLNFTSGYSLFGNAPICAGSTVAQCLVGRDGFDSSTVGRFAYDSGHMERHVAAVMGLANADNAALAADLNATLGNLNFSYTVQQPAAGVVVSTQGYAEFLRKVMRNELTMGSALGSNKVCAQKTQAGCNAAFAPDSVATEAWNYSLGHWVEDDPGVGDHAYSSPGGGGFYPWIDNTRTVYGIVARQRETESAAGYHSAECGRLIRQAWRTGSQVTAVAPTPN